jgi:hypothetical protein
MELLKFIQDVQRQSDEEHKKFVDEIMEYFLCRAGLPKRGE